MQKLAQPISIFVLTILGLFLILLKIKASEILTIEASFVFAGGVFLVSLSLGLLFLNYLSTDNDTVEIETTKDKIEKKTIETKIKRTDKVEFNQNIKNKSIPKEALDKQIKLVDINSEIKVNKPRIEQKKEDIFLNQSINKKIILDLFTNLKTTLSNEKQNYQKEKSTSRLINFFAFSVIVFIIVFLSFNYNFISYLLLAVTIVLALVLVFIMFKYKKTQKIASSNLLNISDRLTNLEQISKRFKSISPKNLNVLKNTVDSLTSENKEYIYNKIKK